MVRQYQPSQKTEFTCLLSRRIRPSYKARACMLSLQLLKITRVFVFNINHSWQLPHKINSYFAHKIYFVFKVTIATWCLHSGRKLIIRQKAYGYPCFKGWWGCDSHQAILSEQRNLRYQKIPLNLYPVDNLVFLSSHSLPVMSLWRPNLKI